MAVAFGRAFPGATTEAGKDSAGGAVGTAAVGEGAVERVVGSMTHGGGACHVLSADSEPPSPTAWWTSWSCHEGAGREPATGSAAARVAQSRKMGQPVKADVRQKPP